MSISPPSRRTKTAIRTAAVVLALMLALSGCFTRQQNQVATYVNRSRAAVGVRPVEQNLELSIKAQRWAEYLARRGSLVHSRLPDGISYRWKSLAENVGYGSSIRSIHLDYMRSPGHRANILNRKFNYIGTGYATRGSRIYTVQVFMQY